MVNWKIIAVMGGLAFVLSLLIGMIAGVAVVNALLRAVLWAAIFAALALAAGFLIKQFLPELMEDSSQLSESSFDDLDDFETVQPQSSASPDSYDDVPDYKGTGSNEISESDNDKGAGLGLEETDEADEQELSDSSGFDEDESALPDINGLQAEGFSAKNDSASSEEGVDSTVSVDKGRPAYQDSEDFDEGTENKAEDVDSLPDFSNDNLDQVSGSSLAADSGDSVSSGFNNDSKAGELAGEDPEILAKAVSTYLKKDE